MIFGYTDYCFSVLKMESINVVIFCLDLDNLFNWNVKQLFVYLTAEYMTTNNVCISSLH